MQRLYSMFPGGWPGTALFLIRAGVGAGLLLENQPLGIDGLGPFDLPVRIALAALLLAGMFTPVAAAIVVAMAAADLIATATTNVPAAVLVALDAIALALLGPGAYSFDARRFGRRVLVTTGEAKRDRSRPKR